MAKTLLGCSESVYAWSFNDGADPETPIAPIWVAQPRPGDAGMKVRQFEVVWAPQHVAFASAGEDGRIILHRPNGEYLGSLSSVTTVCDTYQAIHSIDFHPKSRILVSGGEDSVVRVWDLKEKKVALSWKVHNGCSVVSVRCSPDEDHVASASVDGSLFVHNLRNGKTVTKLQQRHEEAKDAFKMIQFSPFERSRIAGCTDTGKVLVWDSSRAKLLTSIVAHIAPCSAIAYSQVNAALLISAGLDKTVKLHDIRARKTVATFELDSPATSLDMASDGITLAVGTSSGRIHIFDLQQASKPNATLTTANPNATEVEFLTFQHIPQNANHHTSSGNSSSASTLKTPRTSSSVSTTQTDNFFVPSPHVPAPTQSDNESDSITSVLTSSRNSLGSAHDLFSPIKAFEVGPQMSSTPNLHLGRSLSSLDMGFSPMAGSQSSLPGNILSPVQTSSSSTALAASGTPLALLSPAPPTPSSYKYTSRNLATSSSLFSPLGSGAMAPSMDSPIRAPSFTSDSIGALPFSTLSSSDISSYASGAFTPRKSLNASQLGLSPMPSLSSPSMPELPTESPRYSDKLMQTTPPASPMAPKSTFAEASNSAQDANSAPVSHEGIQLQLLQSVVSDMMSEFRSDVQAQLQNMHMEMIRQFHIQKTEIAALLQEYNTNKQLVDIIKELKEENERLRKLY